MSELGNYLKQKREEQGLTLEQIYSLTRIRPDVIKQIESSSNLEKSIFLKSMMKNYARALGVDPSSLSSGGKQVSKSKDTYFSKSSSKKYKLSSRAYVRLAFVFLTLALIFLVKSRKESKFILPSNQASQEDTRFLNLYNKVYNTVFKKELILIAAQDIKLYFKTDDEAMVTKNLVAYTPFVIKAHKKIYFRIDSKASIKLVHKGREQENFTPIERFF